MTVRVRLFAALRESARQAETTSDAADVASLVAELCGRYGESFTRRVALASVLVDGNRVDLGSVRPLTDGAEVALLPPFSGG